MSYATLRKVSSVSPTLIRDIRNRLSPDTDKPLSQERFSKMIGVSLRTVARWETGAHPDPHNAQKLARLQNALDKIDDMVKREYLLDFFEQHHPLLLGLRPIDLIDTEEGSRVLLQRIKAAETGAFA